MAPQLSRQRSGDSGRRDLDLSRSGVGEYAQDRAGGGIEYGTVNPLHVVFHLLFIAAQGIIRRMINATIQKRLIKLEAEMKMLKRTIPRPDLSIEDRKSTRLNSSH